MSEVKYTCPECGSDKVSELIGVWNNPNTGQTEDYGLIEGYPDHFWCDKCEKGIDEFKMIEVTDE